MKEVRSQEKPVAPKLERQTGEYREPEPRKQTHEPKPPWEPGQGCQHEEMQQRRRDETPISRCLIQLFCSPLFYVLPTSPLSVADMLSLVLGQLKP